MRRLSHPRFVVTLALMAVLTAVLWRPLGYPLAVSLSFDIGAVGFVGWVIVELGGSDAHDIRRHAAQNDVGRAALLAIAAVLTVVVLVTVGVELGNGARSDALLEIALPVVTVVIAWTFANTVYTLHYAHLFYDDKIDGGDKGGLDFPHTGLPDYWDFAYFAFTLGMTYQTSDTAVTTSRMRRVVLLHSTIAFFFNIGVLALTLNIVAAAVSGGRS